MTAPLWRSQNTPNSSTGTVSTNFPTGFQADDILILTIVAEETAASIATPSGFTQIGSTLNSGSGTTGQKMAVFWKRATGSETTITVADSGVWTMTSMQAISGCIASGNPVDSFATTTQSTANSTVTCPEITTTEADCIIVFTVGHGVGSAGAKFNSGYTYPTNIIAPNAKRTDYAADVGGLGQGGGTACWTGTMGAAGLTGGTFSAVVGAPNNTRWCSFTIALKPLDAPKSDTDTGSVTESESISGTVVDTDTGTGSETEEVSIPTANSDTGTGSETESVSITTHHFFGDNFNRVDESPLNVSSSGEVWTNV
jgi:hypothetical protein